jgi:hypothetical protein
MSLTPALQAIGRQAISAPEIEDFIVAYDGVFVMIGAICLRNEFTSAVCDVRDRLITILTPILPGLLEVVPCLTHETISVVSGPPTEHETRDRRETYLGIENQTVGKCVEVVYSALSGGMHVFYAACDSAHRATEIASKIREHQHDLFSACKEFLRTTWRNPLRRRAIVNRMKDSTIDILENLTRYSSGISVIHESQDKIEMHKAHSPLFRSFIDKVSYYGYTNPETVDVGSIMGTIEHVRSEGETYSSFMSNLTSALLGGVIGSILTIAASFLLGVK